jgi:hypothetical protein
MVAVHHYPSGDAIRSGDRVRFRGSEGIVEFVVLERVGDAARDWYLDEFGGGVMISAEGLGAVFLGPDDLDQDLEFISRSE